MADMTVPRGDYGQPYPFTVNNPDGTPFDITSYTINFKMWKGGIPEVLVTSGVCSVIADPDNNKCQFTPGINDFVIKTGNYNGELEFIDTGVKISTISFTVEVTESP